MLNTVKPSFQKKLNLAIINSKLFGILEFLLPEENRINLYHSSYVNPCNEKEMVEF